MSPLILGKPYPTKTDEILEKFQPAFDPPLPPPNFGGEMQGSVTQTDPSSGNRR